MLLPLHSLLGLSSFENVTLVVDNAKSPINPVSFRQKRQKPRPAFLRSQSCSDTETGNRWLSHPPNTASTMKSVHPCSTDRRMRPPERAKSLRKDLLDSPSRLVPMGSRLMPPVSFPKLPVRRLSPKSQQSPRSLLRKVQSMRTIHSFSLLEEAC